MLIIGGSSARCVLAARLSEYRHRRVILFEAGRDLRASDVPAAIASGYPGRVFLNQGYLWRGLSALMGTSKSNVPNARMLRRYERAKILDGGSVVNAVAANRGAPSDYEEWGDLGATGGLGEQGSRNRRLTKWSQLSAAR